MNDTILNHNNTEYGRGDLYPTADGKAKFFLLEKKMYDVSQDEIDTECVYDSLDDLCSDTDWWEYCTEKYGSEWLRNYLGEWGYLPLCIAECQPCGTVRRYLLQDLRPIDGDPVYTPLDIEGDQAFYHSLEAAGILKFIW